MTSRSGPNTLMPTGVLMPVEQHVEPVADRLRPDVREPGKLQRCVHLRLQLLEASARAATASRGFSSDGRVHHAHRRVVGGASCRARRCRTPAPPPGTRAAAVSCTWSSRVASVIDSPGGDVGMYSSDPSYSGGMNSLPIANTSGIGQRHDREVQQRAPPTSSAARAAGPARRATRRTARPGSRDSGLQAAAADEACHQHRHERDRQQRRRTPSPNVLVNASGRNMRPSCASSRNTGTNETMMIASEKKIGARHLRRRARRSRAAAPRTATSRAVLRLRHAAVGVLHHDDRGVDQHADGQRDAAERHDVGRSRRGSTSG